jgi:hypothetical protein
MQADVDTSQAAGFLSTSTATHQPDCMRGAADAIGKRPRNRGCFRRVAYAFKLEIRRNARHS